MGPVVSPELLRELPANAYYIGTPPHEDVPAVMRSADVFVLPSLEDSYGLVTAEAMGVGTPVVVSSNCGASEMIFNGQNGMAFPAGDTSALVSAIEILANDAGFRDRIAGRGQETVRESFTWQQYSDRVIRELTKKQGAVLSAYPSLHMAQNAVG